MPDAPNPKENATTVPPRREARAELIWEGKYDANRKRVAPLRVALPFQTVETVNESTQERQRSLFLPPGMREEEWRNRLIWGDKKYVLPSLLPELAGKVNLIYIDPPFDTGADFSFTATVPSGPRSQPGETPSFTKEPSILEHKAYRDTWGRGLDSYLQWFYDTVALVRELLNENGSLYVHLDYHCGHYAKCILDEVFGVDAFRNEIVWWYYNKLQGNVNHFPRNHDIIFYYVKGQRFKFERLSETREKPKKQQRRVWDSATGSHFTARAWGAPRAFRRNDDLGQHLGDRTCAPEIGCRPFWIVAIGAAPHEFGFLLHAAFAQRRIDLISPPISCSARRSS